MSFKPGLPVPGSTPSPSSRFARGEVAEIYRQRRTGQPQSWPVSASSPTRHRSTENPSVTDASLLQESPKRVEPLELDGIEAEGQCGFHVQGAVINEDGVLRRTGRDPQRVLVDRLVGLHLAEITRHEEPAENLVELERPDPILVEFARLVVEREEVADLVLREFPGPFQGLAQRLRLGEHEGLE